MIFVNPTSYSAIFTKELATSSTIILNVFEVKFWSASCVLAMGCISCSEYEFLGFRLCCQIKWSVLSRIGFVQVNTSREIALQDFQIAWSCSLMNTCVTVHIDIKWWNTVLKKNPYYFMITLITCPMERCILTMLACIHWFYEGIFFFIIVCLHYLFVTLFIFFFIAGTSV